MQTLNQTKLAAELGISTETVHRLRKQGAITPVIHEGQTIRYDLDQVKEQLSERAKSNTKKQ